MWNKLATRGVLCDDKSAWQKPMEFIAENYNGSLYRGKRNRLVGLVVGQFRRRRGSGLGYSDDEWHVDMRGESSTVNSPD
ncbi:MAG: hypothetical protein ABI210_12220 [Abditibacteriaceae bacterium]